MLSRLRGALDVLGVEPRELYQAARPYGHLLVGKVQQWRELRRLPTTAGGEFIRVSPEQLAELIGKQCADLFRRNPRAGAKELLQFEKRAPELAELIRKAFRRHL